MHPAIADLVAYFDGELPSETQARIIEEHVQHCESCRKELCAIEEDFLLFSHLAGEIPVQSQVKEGMHAIQQAMAGRSAEGPSRVSFDSELPFSPAILASISKELTIYLGARGVEKLMARMGTTTLSVEELVANIGPLMVGLLGDRGGSAVAGRIATLCCSPAARASGLGAQ